MAESELQKYLGARLASVRQRLGERTKEVVEFTKEVAELEVALSAISTVATPKEPSGKARAAAGTLDRRTYQRELMRKRRAAARKKDKGE